MYELDKERARKILLEQNLKVAYVDKLLKSFSPIDDSLGAYVEQWLTDRTVPDVVIKDVRLPEVIEKRNCHFLIAIRDIDRLFDPNLTNEKRKQWLRILTTPVHYE